MLGRVFSFWTGAAILAVLSALCFTGERLSVGDFLSHFPAYWALLALGFALCAAVKRRWVFCAVGAGLFFIHAVPVVSLWLPDRRAPSSSEKAATLTVVSANLYASNARKPEALAELMKLSPDVLILIEIGREWRTVLKPILGNYPHGVGTGGTIWMLSRHPLRRTASTEIRMPGLASSSPMLEATVMVTDSAIRIVGIHATRPKGSVGIAQQRNQAADYVQAFERDSEARHRLLIGDFNTTPFSAVFRHIVQITGLRDASKGRGYQPTWGPRLPREPMLPWLGIPIDHALVSEQVLVEDRRIGEMPGSDHRYQQMKLRF